MPITRSSCASTRPTWHWISSPTTAATPSAVSSGSSGSTSTIREVTRLGRPSWSAVAALIAAALLATPFAARAAPLSVLTYNVNGLFRGAAESDPGARTPMIGWLANRYDVVLLQEDFEYHDVIA